MRTVSSHEVATDQEATSALPARVQEVLGELAGAAKEGLLALSVGVGPFFLIETCLLKTSSRAVSRPSSSTTLPSAPATAARSS